MRGFLNLVSVKESGFMDISAGEWELPAERKWEGLGYGFERLWEGLIGLKMCGDGLLYALAIKGDFKRHQIALDSRKRKSARVWVMLISFRTTQTAFSESPLNSSIVSFKLATSMPVVVVNAIFRSYRYFRSTCCGQPQKFTSLCSKQN
jgi:hypothetical protein